MNYTSGMSNILNTADAVIDALGRTSEVARLSGRPMQAVSNWRRAGRIPSELILIHRAELRRRGFDAPASIWGVVDPAHPRPAAQEPAP